MYTFYHTFHFGGSLVLFARSFALGTERWFLQTRKKTALWKKVELDTCFSKMRFLFGDDVFARIYTISVFNVCTVAVIFRVGTAL